MCLRGKKKRLNKERNPSDPWDDIKRLCVAGVSVGQRQNEAENNCKYNAWKFPKSDEIHKFTDLRNLANSK